MHTRKFGVLAAVAASALALGVAACGGSDGSSGGSGGSSGSAGKGGGQPYIAIVSKGFQHQFWQAVKQGAEQEAKTEGARITFEGPPTEQDIEQQVTMLTNALEKKPAALGFAALDSKASAPLMDQAKSEHIPVIAFDSGVDSNVPVTTAATNNKAAAAEAAKHLAQKIGMKGKVAVICHDQTSRSGIDRRDGFLAWMKANAPGIQVLPVQYGGGDQAKSADIAKSIMAANKDLKGFFGCNEGSAVGIIKGVEESGKKGITIVGFDSGQGQIDAIKSGVMAGAITQDPIGMGKELIKSAMKAIKGESMPKFIDTGFYWYDKTNLDDPKIKA
ncbi:MAG TPA: ABC transporter substrate-binding protein, partial [Thermoleophilaceae bacterium]|nr:ABC transporter substrate-binding protein [Thermoleophilaceae bacterium]